MASPARAPARPYRDVSFWLDALAESGADSLAPRDPLDGDLEVDVCIVGAGLTGLWTAHYLLQADPGTRIAIVEKEIAGFGASGRNGGWCSALFPRSAASLERSHGRSAAVAMRRAMVHTVDEVDRATRELGIDCDWAKGGTLALVRSSAQRRAAESERRAARRYGVDQVDFTEVGNSATPALFDPSCARVQPGKLVRQLAQSLERRGVRILEKTAAVDFEPRRVHTRNGTVRCERVVLALEGYGATLAKTHRRVLPLYSLMIATEPLPDAVWDEIGIRHGTTFTDYRHLLIYGQRTADNRVAFGGRGARYHFGSTIRPKYDRVEPVFRHLERALGELFPPLSGAVVTHRWGGPLGVPRDWHPSVSFNPRNGIAWAGGYVGDGLSTTNLAGRTLADLITGRASELVTLPWVGHRSPNWEIEPLRFLGANLGMAAMAAADREEAFTRRSSVLARAVGPLVGH